MDCFDGEGAYRKGSGLFDIIFPPVLIPVRAGVADKKLSYLYRALQVGIAVFVIYMLLTTKFWIVRVVPEINNAVVGYVDTTSQVFVDQVNDTVHSDICQNPEKYSYYNPAHGQKPGFVNNRCVTLPHFELVQNGETGAFFATFFQEFDGNRYKGDALCQRQKRNCEFWSRRSTKHFEELPAHIDGKALCQCVEQGNYFSLGAELGKVTVEYAYQVSFKSGGGQHFMVGSSGSANEYDASNPSEKLDSTRAWVMKAAHAHADTTPESQRNAYRKFEPGADISMSVKEWLEAAGIDDLTQPNTLAGENALGELMEAGEFPTAESSFQQADLNKDGNLDITELETEAEQDLVSLDNDAKNLVKAQLDRLDVNGDSVVSLDEFKVLWDFNQHATLLQVGVKIQLTVDCMSKDFHEQQGVDGTICFIEVNRDLGWNQWTKADYDIPILAGVGSGTFRHRSVSGISFYFGPPRGTFGEPDAFSALAGLAIFSIYASLPALIVSLIVLIPLPKLNVYKHGVQQKLNAARRVVGYAARYANAASTWKQVIEEDVLREYMKEMFSEEDSLSDSQIDTFMDLVKTEMRDWNKHNWCRKLADDHTMSPSDVASFVKSIGATQKMVRATASKLQKKGTWSSKVQPVEMYNPDNPEDGNPAEFQDQNQNQ